MKLYFIGQKIKRFQPLAVILAEYLNLDLNVLSEQEINNIVEPSDLVYYIDNTSSVVINKPSQLGETPSQYINFDTSKYLSNKCFLLGSDKHITDRWNNKSYQLNSLKNIIVAPQYKLYGSIIDIIKDITYLKSNFKKFIIFENISDGGKRCHVCDEKTKPAEFFNKFKLYKDGFRVSKFLDNIHNVSLHFIIASPNKFWISPIIDQLIDNEVVFKGGTYPSIISKSLEDKVIEETSKIAEVLSKAGYVGLCHVDFMISNGIVYFTEINPRKAGSTMCVSYMMENCFNTSIPIIEYYAIKEKRIIDVKQIKKCPSWRSTTIPWEKNAGYNPGDERELFKSESNEIVTYNEYHNECSFRINLENKND